MSFVTGNLSPAGVASAAATGVSLVYAAVRLGAPTLAAAAGLRRALLVGGAVAPLAASVAAMVGVELATQREWRRRTERLTDGDGIDEIAYQHTDVYSNDPTNRDSVFMQPPPKLSPLHWDWWMGRDPRARKQAQQ